MTTLAQGNSATCTPRDNGSIAIATNGGFATAVVTPTVGPAVTYNLGPAPERRILGPFSEGATIVISNQSCSSLDYDVGGGGFDPSNVNIGGGSINGVLVSRIAGPTRSTPVRIATFGDSTASTATASPDVSDVRVISAAFPASGSATVIGNNGPKFFLPSFYPQAYLVANCGITGTSSSSMVTRDTLAASTSRKAVQDALDMAPDVILFRGGSINDLGSVTSANWKTTADNSFANHKTLMARMLAGGVIVIDEGIYAYGDGAGATAVDPASTRLAVQYFNSLCAAYAANFPGQVYFIDPVAAGIQASDGRYVPSQTFDGVHLSNSGSVTIAKKEAAIVQAIFGPPAWARYPGVNLAVNSLLHSSSGGLATGFNLPTPSNCTWGTPTIETINGKPWQTVELTITGTGATATMGMFSGVFPLTSVNLNDIIGWEYDVLIQGKNGYIPRPTDVFARFDILKTGAGRVINETQFGTDASSDTTIGRLVFQPQQFTDVTTIAYKDAYAVGLTYQSDEVGQIIKLGISSPRMVKL